jgi:uncharacterized protein YndB with AHSA1/START domain
VASSGKATVTLPTDEQILITREFEAPKDLAYRAWTEPELVRRWWGGERGEVTVVEIDLQVGGAWRCVMITGDGSEAAFRGEYREIVPNERIVSTEVYEGMPGAEALNTVTLQPVRPYPRLVMGKSRAWDLSEMIRARSGTYPPRKNPTAGASG